MRTTISQPDTKTAIEFLRVVGRRTLAAIDPHKDVAAPVCITPDRLEDARAWIDKRNGRVNLYFTVNPTRAPMSRKPSEADIACFTFAHVECDPLPGEPSAAARKRHRAALKALPYPPSLIWDTGNGCAALWRLEEPIKLIDGATIADCKAINVGLIEALGGRAAGVDTCQNLDRLLRLPGTVNIPDKRKLAAGRTVEVAGNVEHHPERVYALSDLPTASGAASSHKVDREIGEPITVDDLSSLNISDRIRTIIELGRVPGEVKEADDSRSAWECEAVCAMIRAGIAEDMILGLLTDERYAISERVLERPDPEAYAKKEIVRLGHRLAAELRTDFAEPADVPADALDDLVERTKLDQAAPFAPEVLQALAALPPDQWESMRTAIKAAGFTRMAALEKAIGKASKGKAGKKRMADRLFDLGQEAVYFRDNDEITYAHVLVSGVRQTLGVKSQAFRKWLTKRYHQSTGQVPGKTVLDDAIRATEATADTAPRHRTFTRVGATATSIYVDLGDESWEAVEIGAEGWRVIKPQDLPEGVNFKRTPGMQALPKPVAGGSLAELRPFLNVEQDGDTPSLQDGHFVLAVMWIVGCFRTDIPYPIIPIAGEHGSAKTTTCEFLRLLIDPALPAAKTLPRDERDLYIAANANHVLCFDNVSYIPEWLSDALCRMATGGGFGTRALYTDDEERLFTARRPIIINGITSVVWRPDLVDRSLFIGLQPIKVRRPENELKASFLDARPRILGALFDIIAHGLGRLPHIKPDAEMPRMADFDLFARACETKVWKAGTFRRAYGANRVEAKERILKADAVAEAVTMFMALELEWSGTATELLKELDNICSELGLYDRKWPVAPHDLSRRLRIIAPDMRAIRNIDIRLGEDNRKNTKREIKITAT